MKDWPKGDQFSRKDWYQAFKTAQICGQIARAFQIAAGAAAGYGVGSGSWEYWILAGSLWGFNIAAIKSNSENTRRLIFGPKNE